ncbi:sodium:solute symporter family protein [Brevibacillus marinus]|uniref:sodium:solute symporter family protein n=1 Tax=Brevibacillus marinus TaxID=2496837 RepID=UPI0013DEB3F1|nr:sodium:solute symporter family protein [Brevibacillus marinus]
MRGVDLFLSFAVVLAVTVVIGYAAKRAVRTARDFANAGGTLGSGMVAGALIGGFVGGTSVLGTAELAFRQGLTALWFTLGGGIAIILVGLFAGRLRSVGAETLPAVLGHLYGDACRLGASLFLSAGMFIQIVAQLLAALPLLSVLGPLPLAAAAAIPALLILLYVFFGGFIGASMVGMLKTVMLLGLLIGTGMWLFAGLPLDTYRSWWEAGRLSLFADGLSTGWAQGLAMIIGIFSTQAYLQPVFAARSAAAARSGSLIAGLLVILVGLISAWIGLFMRDIHPEIVPREAVPQFFILHAPGWITGAALAVILLSVVMTGAALVLSMGTIINQDVIQRVTSRFASDRKQVRLSRLLIVLLLCLAYLLVISQADSYILDWAFLSMTLRGVTVFFPLIFYLFNVRLVSRRKAMIAVWGGPISALLWAALAYADTGVDPLYIGAAFCLLVLLSQRQRQKTTDTTTLR